jgi:hypothetical protein
MVAIRRFRCVRHFLLSVALLLSATFDAEANASCTVYEKITVTPPANLIESRQDDTLRFSSGADSRSETMIALLASRPSTAQDFQQYETLPDAELVLRYMTETLEGGSGGAEVLLTGEVLHNDAFLLRVTCRTQSESTIDPTWCLPTLRSITYCDAACDCGAK